MEKSNYRSETTIHFQDEDTEAEDVLKEGKHDKGGKKGKDSKKDNKSKSKGGDKSNKSEKSHGGKNLHENCCFFFIKNHCWYQNSIHYLEK